MISGKNFSLFFKKIYKIITMQQYDNVPFHLRNRWFKYRSNDLGFIDGYKVSNDPFQIVKVGATPNDGRPHYIPNLGKPVLVDEFDIVCVETSAPLMIPALSLDAKSLVGEDFPFLKKPQPITQVQESIVQPQVVEQIQQQVTQPIVKQSVQGQSNSIFDNCQTEKRKINLSVELELPNNSYMKTMFLNAKSQDLMLDAFCEYFKQGITDDVIKASIKAIMFGKK